MRMRVVLPAPFDPRIANTFALRHVQVDTVHCAQVAEGLDQPARPDRRRHYLAIQPAFAKVTHSLLIRLR